MGVGAEKLPSASSSWGRNNKANYRSNPDDDIPIVGGDHFRDHSKKGVGKSRLGMLGRRSKRKLKRRRRDDDIVIDDDVADGYDDVPLPFFFEQDEFDHDDDDGWPQREFYDRRHKRRKSKINHHHPFDSFRHWAFDTTGVHIPRINLHLNPITIIKMRKAWHNLIPGAVVRAGADFESRGVWRFRGCVEDKLIGGRFTIKKMKYVEDEEDDNRVVLMEYSKSWLIPGAGKLGRCDSTYLHSPLSKLSERTNKIIIIMNSS